MKALAKSLLRKAGVEAHSYLPGSSREAQLVATLRHFQTACILDIGANTGQFGAEVYDAGYRGRVISVEPIPAAHGDLTRRAAGYTGWVVHPATAVGAQAGSVSFQVSANSVSSSVLPVTEATVAAAPEARQLETIDVPLTTVDQLVAAHGVERSNNLLKIDTQGYESQVLDGARQSIGVFDLVLLELSLVELYRGQTLWLDLIQRLQAVGFGVWFVQSEFVQPATGQTLQLNACFYRLGR